MKLQIQAQNLRFRIDKAELGRLLSGESVEDVTHLGEGTTCGQSVRLAEMRASWSGSSGDRPLRQIDAGQDTGSGRMGC